MDSVNAKILQLRTENGKLKSAILEQHIYSRKNNLEIKAVPESVGKINELRSAFVNFCSMLEVDVNPNDVDNIHRIPTKNKTMPRPIVVKLRPHMI